MIFFFSISFLNKRHWYKQTSNILKKKSKRENFGRCYPKQNVLENNRPYPLYFGNK